MNDNGMPQNIAGFAIGLAVGALLAVLFAPQSGEETRQYLMDGASDTIDGVMSSGRRFRKRARRVVSDMAERVMDATDAAEQAHHKAKNA